MPADPLAPVDLPAPAAPVEAVEWEMSQTGRVLRGGRNRMRGQDELSPGNVHPTAAAVGCHSYIFGTFLARVFFSLNHLEVIAEPEGQTGG